MENKSDALLRKMIKNWANRYNPPDNGRARLLWETARTSRTKIDLSSLFFHPKINTFPSSYSNDWTQTLFTWISENSFQYGLQARLS